MERINRNNYEVYFIDYFDGNLDSEQIQDLMVFLNNYPDLREEFETFKTIRLPVEEVAYPDKNTLKEKLTIQDEEYSLFDELCIRYFEGELNEGQKREFYQHLEASPKRKKEFESYRRTIQKPDKKIRFPKKYRLKKGRMIDISRNRIYQYVALAASVLLLVGLYFLLPGNKDLTYSDNLNNEINNIDNENNKVAISSIELPPIPEKEIELEYSKIDDNRLLSQASNEINTPDRLPNNDLDNSKPLQSIKQKYQVKIQENPVYAGIIEPKDNWQEFQLESKSFNSYDKVNRFLSQRIENTLNQTIPRRKINLWEIADLGFKGISKLTGKEIFLERQYDSRGDLEKLAFKTESFKIATRLKK
jgi:hypothetical protein